jgi:hypothetical protein
LGANSEEPIPGVSLRATLEDHFLKQKEEEKQSIIHSLLDGNFCSDSCGSRALDCDRKILLNYVSRAGQRKDLRLLADLHYLKSRLRIPGPKKELTNSLIIRASRHHFHGKNIQHAYTKKRGKKTRQPREKENPVIPRKS